ncbi:MFS transporter [Ilumatobacter nonamiensis]|uniref:MFS transporter n=1 Tax=Ilumatobacter nonamiensis TaxID=467093 RepID=UPI0003474975|nr:MFS transporter [Ilumatobacter nonamiensis]
MTDTIAPDTPPADPSPTRQGWLRGWFQSITGDGPLYALLILFGLNAVDELDRTAFAILSPEIREEFGLGFTGLLTLIAAVLAIALALQVPIAGLADRYPRVRIALIGATVWACFSFMTGLAAGIVMLGFARSGSGLGKAVNDPTHNSLIADWFDPDHRPKVYSFHRAANAVGAIVGPIAAGLLAYQFGWRTPFFVFAIPTLILVFFGLRLREPVRGGHERRLAGGDAEAIATEEAPPSYAEAWRMCWKIETLRRIFVAMPFLAVSLIGFGVLAALLYEEAYGLDERARGIVAATSEPGQLIGLTIGARIATKLVMRDPGLILKFLAVVSVATAALSLIFAVVPNLGVAIVANFLIALCLAIVGPGILASLSLAIPPRARSMGFSMASLWVLPGLLMLPFIGWIADSWGIRTGMAMMVPVFVIGGLIIASGGKLVNHDIIQVRTTALARAEVMNQRKRGEVKLLLARGVNVGYSGVRVLHDIDIEIDEGSVVALLGTNGAGKSTLLKAISGVVEADQGAIIFDGRDITHAPPNEIAGHGIVQIPGGHGVFPGLTVGENLDAAGWLNRGDQAALDRGMATVLDTFPALAKRLDEPAANLSGGQQQMLALGMSFLVTPRLLMIDELSLGLAPVIVEQLMKMVRKIAATGVTIILVEQSVNVALELADTAYFMERGRIRFHGPTAELIERDDLLRSVFLGDQHQPATPPTPGEPSTNGHATDPDSDAPTALTVRGLSRRFGGVSAVRDVDVDVAEREIVGFIGPNGAGKTTLFDLIGGTTPSDSGRVELGGQDLTSATASERARSGLGRSFQDARLFPSLTVQETISVALERWVRSRDPISAALHLPTTFDSEADVVRRVDELIELMNLGAYRHKRIKELSTGSRRIVDLACVVAHRPTVVLLDEPSSGIAQREVEALAPVIERMRSEMGSALLVIEHDMNLLSAIADRVVALDQGAVIAVGRPAEVLADPRVVASYLGTDPTAIERSNAPTN